MVAFDGEPLSLAVAEVNRHSRRKIVIDDPELEAQPIVGRFRAADAEGFCRVAAVALGATAVEEGNTIHLRP
jgi:transmembrane sensor